MRIATLFGLLVAAFTLSGCGVNPVTGKKEIQFVSEASEIKIGEQQYAPTQQSQGGDFDILPDLTAYVNEVGQKLAAVSDRKLPYEFVVLNNPVPNAWALPGGKIAVNAGLLTELKNEAELAAVLGHEIVHAAARHGAKAQERMELKLDRGLANRRIFPAVDVNASGTRREEILLSGEELKIMWKLRRVLAALDQQQGIELLIDRLKKTKSNVEFLMQVQQTSSIRIDDEEK
jgi:predicted Zn-dependent protease